MCVTLKSSFWKQSCDISCLLVELFRVRLPAVLHPVQLEDGRDVGDDLRIRKQSSLALEISSHFEPRGRSNQPNEKDPSSQDRQGSPATKQRNSRLAGLQTPAPCANLRQGSSMGKFLQKKPASFDNRLILMSFSLRDEFAWSRWALNLRALDFGQGRMGGERLWLCHVHGHVRNVSPQHTSATTCNRSDCTGTCTHYMCVGQRTKKHRQTPAIY